MRRSRGKSLTTIKPRVNPCITSLVLQLELTMSSKMDTRIIIQKRNMEIRINEERQ